jgi:hypothetical protein
MRSLAWLALLGICASVSCGARSSLRDLIAADDEDPSGGGGTGPGSVTTATTTTTVSTGGEGGSAPPPDCPVVELTDYALSEVVLDGPSIHGVRMTKATGAPSMVCAAGPIQEQAPTTPYGAICFDAFGAWPSLLPQPTALVGSSVGQLRVAPGVPDGIAVITGDDGDIVAPVGKYTPSWLPGRSPSWFDLSVGGELVPMFIAPAKDTHVAGVVLGDVFESWLSISSSAPNPTDFVGAACAQGQVAADGIYDDGTVIAVATSGASVGGCLVEPVTEARRLQVVSWPFGGSPNAFIDEDWGTTIDDVQIADAQASFWVAALVDGAVSVMRLSKTGAVELPLTHVTTSAAGMSIAARGDELLVATVDWTDPDLSADISVQRVSADGAIGTFGGFDTNEASWLNDLALVVSDDQLHAVVGYHAGPGQLAARRFDCVTE